MKHFFNLMIVALALSLIPAGKLLAHVEKTYFLHGKIGDREIAIKMLCYDELTNRYIHYFFINDKKDRYLEGKWAQNSWRFVAVEMQGSNAKPEGAFNIAESNNGNWKGTWTDSMGKKQDIVLQPIITDAIVSPYSNITFVAELDPYEYYRLSLVSFKIIKTEKFSAAITADWYADNESGICFFRLRTAGNKLTTDSINTALTTLHLTLLQQYFTYEADKWDTKTDTRLQYINNALISFTILTTTTFSTKKAVCTRQLLTLDTRSGEQVNLEDLVWFNKGEEKPLMSDLYKIYKYRISFFAPKVFHLLTGLYPQKMKSDSCGINDAATWALPAWCLTAKGLALSFKTFDKCDVLPWAIIPYGKLLPFLEKKYPLQTKK